MAKDIYERLGEIEPGLRRALVAAYGVDVGRESAAEAIAWACEHAARAASIDNLGGYLYRVGQTAARRQRQAGRIPTPWPTDSVTHPVEIEPALQDALAELSERQRQVVVLVHSYDHQLTEVAALLDCSVSSVRVHLARGMDRLRNALEAHSDH